MILLQSNYFDLYNLIYFIKFLVNLCSWRICCVVCSITVIENVSVLDMWKKAGANFNYANYDGRTALHVAVINNFEDKVRYLVKMGANPHKVDLTGKSSIDLARELKLANIMKFFEENSED